ncbi:MAG TPA: ABC transporter permease [Nitrospiria bacterium]|nr:ABC transporter permease [Nitrospiria bacterium]
MIQTLAGFIRKELTQTLRDRRMRILLFVMPIIQLSLFGIAVSNEVRNIRLAAVIDSKDTILRDIYDRSISGKWFIPARVTRQDPFKSIQSGEADAVLVPPPGGFTRALGRGEAPLQLLVNSTNVIAAQSVEGYLQSIISAAIQDDLHIPPPDPPIQFDVRVLFNPDLQTSIFMVPGTMAMVMIITTMVLTNLAIVREKELGTFEMLISAPISSSEVIYGKTIPYVILGMSNFPFILAVAIFAFYVPMRGSFIALFTAAFAFVCTAVAIGTLISTWCENQQQASLAGFLFMFPMIMFSGLMFPLENMPVLLRWISQLDPLAHFMGLLRNIMLKGGEMNYVVYHTAFLAGLAFISVIASFRRFKTTLQ